MTSGVPRETARIRGSAPRNPPESAVELFGDAVPQAAEYAQLLRTVGVERGLLGPREADRVWARHILNCGVVAEAVPAGATVADVGSGAGLPGIVWALMRPDLELTLVEPLLRRSDFLREAAASLSLRNVEVVRARADDLWGTRTFTVVAARAVAPLERLARWCLPLVRPGGHLLALKGESASAELATTRPSLRAMSATSAVIRTYGKGIVSPPATVIDVLRDPDGGPG